MANVIQSPKLDSTVGDEKMSRLYTASEIAKAAGVRKSQIIKYIEQGVRFTSPLISQEKNKKGEYLVSRAALEAFAARHSGVAGDIALRALRNLKE